jgi:hypothetical protein
MSSQPTKQNSQKERPWAVFAPVPAGEGERLHQVGVAFPHKEGGGFNIELNSLPKNWERFVVLPPREGEAAA